MVKLTRTLAIIPAVLVAIGVEYMIGIAPYGTL